MKTLGAFLERAVGKFGPRPALLNKPRYRTQVWTYEQLWHHTTRVARWLQEQGVQKGERVTLWAPNSPWWVASFFASARLGAIVVPLDVRSSPEFVAHVVERTEPRLALLSALTAPSWPHPIPTETIENFESLPELDGDLRLPDVAPSDIAEVLFTSGTTGDPKGVILTHDNITSNAAAVDQVIPNLPSLRLLSILPLSHMFEQTAGLILPFGRGASIVYPASRQSTVLFRTLQEQRITTMLTVPQALQLFMDAIEREVRKQGREEMWQRLRFIAGYLPLPGRRLLFRAVHRQLGGELAFFVSGGAPLDPSLIESWELLGIPIVQGYGTTETSPIITGTSLDDHQRGSVGRALPGVQVRIAPDGEVLVRGPNVTPGYWRDPVATAAAFEDGWYKTGDLGELDSDGFLFLRGRKKNLIVLANGQNVFPEDVEWTLRQIEGVSDAIVLGIPAPRGTEVHAVLLCDPSVTDPGALVRQANARSAPHQQIQNFTVWSGTDFPRTHTMKVKRHEVLNAILSAREQGQDRPVGGLKVEVAKTPPLLRVIAEAAGVQAGHVTPNATLGDDLGLDSLGRVELLAAIEADLGIYLDEAMVGSSTTVTDLEALVGAQEGATRPTFPSWPLSRPAQGVRRWIRRPVFALLDRIAPAHVSGRQNLQAISPPVLLVANHTSHLDSPVLLRALPRLWRERVAVAAAADYFFSRRWLGALVALLLNAFPFSRTTAVRPTLEHCAHLVDRGWSILLYPEGTRSIDGRMGAFKSGVGLLAVELQVPVIPIRIEGLDQVLPKGRSLPRAHPISIRIGAPLRFAQSTPYETAAKQVEQAVRSLSTVEDQASAITRR